MQKKTGLRLYKRYFKHLVWPISATINCIKVKNLTKIFCIGLNKTGTTSLEAALRELGVIMVNQRRAERLFHDWQTRDFTRLYRLCKTAQGFQDIPFSYPDTYKYLDKEFPGSKFILTIRDSNEEWYNSITRSHSKAFANGKRIPTKEDLQRAVYHEKGRPWESNRALYNTPENEPYKKEVLLEYYNNYNLEVINYFGERNNDLLIINIAKTDSYKKMCKFLNFPPYGETFPHLNKTRINNSL